MDEMPRDSRGASPSPVEEALASLRAQVQARIDLSEPTVQDARWSRAFQVLRESAGGLGMSERQGVIDEFGMDVDAVNEAGPAMDFFADQYWRIEIQGAENLPEVGPCVLVANSSGPVPYDGLMLAHVFARNRDDLPRPHFLVADWMVATPFVQPVVTRMGGVRACHANARCLLEKGYPLVAFPEGFRGSAKAFQDRYRLTPFGTETGIRAALEAGVPLVPVGIVGAEEAHPILYKDPVSAGVLGVPFVPVTPTFPLLGPLGLLPLPSKWVIRIGEPLETPASVGPGSESERILGSLGEALRQRVQGLVDAGLADRESVWS